MAFGSNRRQVADAEINLTSLIDILFIVLIFLVLTTSFAKRTGIELRLPESAQQREPAPPQALRIELTQEGAIYLNGSAVDIGKLGAALAEVSDKDRAIILRADRQAHHGAVVEVLDAVRGAGFRRLAVEATSRGAQ